MRVSDLPLSTTKEVPSDAEITSHRLMLRSGMIRKISGGLYSWLPLGLRSLRKVETIVREEMNAAGAIELLMPTIQPAVLWQESKRWNDYGPELLRIVDRHQRDFVYGPTHEEVITDIARSELTSYRQLPVNYYQIQTKFRDEIRPRFGVMRAREFIMKDAYSFHIDQNSLNETYQKMYDAYSRILQRLQLDFRAVLADTGSIGGNESHEFHVLADSGEDTIAFSKSGSYAANVELVPCAPLKQQHAAQQTLAELKTPNVKTIAELCKQFNFTSQQCLKALFVKSNNGGIIALFIRGDHTLNTVKAQKHPDVASPLEFANEEQIVSLAGCRPGSLGPVRLNLPMIIDHAAAAMVDFVCGANRDDMHYTGVNWGTDATQPDTADLRNVEEGELTLTDQSPITIKRGIEVGHIFKLGTKYSELMKAQVLNQDGKLQTMTMGCYGIGISRIVAAAIEQNYDDDGIIWPLPLAPFSVLITPIRYESYGNVHRVTDELHQQLEQAQIEVLLDDRNLHTGTMFADADLIGIPYRVVISKHGLRGNHIEVKRRNESKATMLACEQCAEYLIRQIQSQVS